jgi:hypothetical protein
MRDGAGGFFQEEAFLRGGEEHAAAAIIPDDLEVVELGVVTEDGELEVVLALGLGVAVASGAAFMSWGMTSCTKLTGRVLSAAGARPAERAQAVAVSRWMNVDGRSTRNLRPARADLASLTPGAVMR